MLSKTMGGAIMDLSNRHRTVLLAIAIWTGKREG